MRFHSDRFLRLAMQLRPKRPLKRRRGESQADANIRRFRALEAMYLRMGFSPKGATNAAKEDFRAVQ
jgi:hypothetical protein